MRLLLTELRSHWDPDRAAVLADWCEERGLLGIAERLRESITDETGALAYADLNALANLMEPGTPPGTFGGALAYYRACAGWSLEAVAVSTGIHADHLARWEKGKALPRSANRQALIQLFPRLKNCGAAEFEARAERHRESVKKGQETQRVLAIWHQTRTTRAETKVRVADRREQLQVGDRVRDLNFDQETGDRVGTVHAIEEVNLFADVWWDASPRARHLPGRFLNGILLTSLVRVHEIETKARNR